MNILGKLPESISIPGKIDSVGLLKVLRVALITGAAAVVAFLITATWVGFDAGEHCGHDGCYDFSRARS